MILAFAGGYVLALVLGFSSGIRNRVRLAGAKKEIKQLRKELDTVREGEETDYRGVSPADGAPEKGSVPETMKGEQGDEEDWEDAEGREGKEEH